MEDRDDAASPLDGDDQDELRVLARLLGDEHASAPSARTEASATRSVATSRSGRASADEVGDAEQGTPVRDDADPDDGPDDARRPPAHAAEADRADAAPTADRARTNGAARSGSAERASDVERDEDAPAPTELLAGRFELVQPLASRPFGDVWRARDHENHDRELALKLVPCEDGVDTDALIDDVRALFDTVSRATSEAINRQREVVLDAGGRLLVASDLVEGENAWELVDRSGVLPPRHALEIVRQVLLGLEAGHAIGLPHGGLVAENVLLANRIPWTDENPFGVGVRLADYGLATVLPYDDAPSFAGDLYAAGALLALLLTGVRHDGEGAEWAGSDASPNTASLSAPARELLDTALSPDAWVRFADPAAFRAALEATEEWKPKARRSRVVPIALGVAVVALVVALGRITGVFGGTTAAKEKEWAAERQQLQADLDSMGSVANETRSVLDDIRSVLGETRNELQTTRGRLESETLRAEAAEEAQRRLAEESAARAREHALAMQDANARITALEAALAQARKREADLMAMRRIGAGGEGEEGADTATAIYLVDQLIDHLVAGDVDAARGAALTFDSDAELTAEKGADRPGLVPLTDAVEALGELEAADGELVRAQLFARAWPAYERALQETAALLESKPAWATYDDGTERPVRGLRLEDLVDAVHRRLLEVRDGLDDALGRRWNELLAAPDVAPDEVERVAAWFREGRAVDPSEEASSATPDARVATFVERYAAWLSERARPEDGYVVADARHLDAWVERLARSPLSDSADAQRELTWLRLARDFGTAPEPPVLTELPALDEGSRGTWRETLWFRAALLDDEVGLPGRPGTRTLHYSVTPEGSASWRWDTVSVDPAPPADADASRVLAQTFYDASGARIGERTMRVFRIGRVLYEEDVLRSELVDLGAPSLPVDVRGTALGGAPDPPPGVGLPGPDLYRFREALADETLWCLVFDEGATRTWWSPTYGLLRHVDPERITSELVYAELP